MDEQQTTVSTIDDQFPQPRLRRLGRGLSALLGGSGDADDGAGVAQSGPAGSHRLPPVRLDEATGAQNHLPAQTESPPSEGGAGGGTTSGESEVAIDRIERNPFQPRKHFEEESLSELVESIRQHGVLQPLLVRSCENGYQLIAGERRWLAAQRAGLSVVPCRVLELDDQKVCEAAIEENLKRKDLNVLEKAQAFQDYLDRFGCSIEKLAQNLSMSRPAVSNMLRLLELPDAVKQLLVAGKISEGHARSILRLEEPAQLALCERIQAESLTVRQTESAVREILKGEPATIPIDSSRKPAPPQMTNHLRSLEEQLRDHLGAKVEIRLSGKDSGQIVIRFDSNDDFERIVRGLRRAA